MGNEILKIWAECLSEVSVLMSQTTSRHIFQKDVILILKTVVNYNVSYGNGRDEFEVRIGLRILCLCDPFISGTMILTPTR